jgi:DDE superfamily endonuclease
MKPSNEASLRASRRAAWGVFWGEVDLKPHKMRYWLNNERAEEPEVFDAEVRAVCEHYAKATSLHQEGVHLVSTDEKTSIQALERLHPPLPMRPGKVECQEHEYVRHGIRCLIANFEVATGRLITPSIGPTRTNEDFASHIARTIATDPDAAGWIFVVDQLNIHQSEDLVKLVGRECDIGLELDRKGNLKHIKSMASRRTFLEDPTHRVRFVYTPKHTSWLNQIELWFSILVRRLLKRGNFISVEDLRQQILEFIEYFNRTMAKPFKWTYKGRPLKV